jgi:hypothetical protein
VKRRILNTARTTIERNASTATEKASKTQDPA